jgi:hypothetical protein
MLMVGYATVNRRAPLEETFVLTRSADLGISDLRYRTA